MPTSKCDFLKKFYLRIFLKSKTENCPKSFSQHCRVPRCFAEANSRKGSKQVENNKKMVIFEIVCCHGNSLQHTNINEIEIPAVWLIFTVNARSLNPKVKQIVHFLFFIVLQVYILLKL